MAQRGNRANEKLAPPLDSFEKTREKAVGLARGFGQPMVIAARGQRGQDFQVFPLESYEAESCGRFVELIQ